MKLIQLIAVTIMVAFFSSNLLAKVYKCSDEQGNTAYQSTPCNVGKKAAEIFINSGAAVDYLAIKEQEEEVKVEQKQLKEAEDKKIVEKEARRRSDSIEQGRLNFLLVKNNPVQYTAFSILAYDIDNPPSLVKQYEDRLPEIEKSRRFAAKKALLSGECLRVESVGLSIKSSSKGLVYSVDCSSAKTFYFSEQDLVG
jgi:hypothetical protein